MLLDNILPELLQQWQRNSALTAEDLCRPYRDHPEHAALLTALRQARRAVPADATAAAPDRPALAELPARVGRYHLEQEIARGGMGRIVRVRDEDFERPLAMKLLLGSGGNPEERFLREARMTGQLQHPGIPPVHERGRLADGRPYFVMKLIQGRSLHELLKERTAPAADLPHWLGIFEQICQTVGYAHARGVIHRDLKPANIMVGAFGEVQVMDWGLAKFIGATDDDEPEPEEGQSTVFGLRRTVALTEATSADSVLGTPAYMAPEQARGEYDRLDARADVFGLGAILCEILTGAPAFRGRDVLGKATRGELTETLERLAGCGADAELVELAGRCLAPRPDDRPADGAAVAATVAAYQAELQRRLHQAEIEGAAAAVRADEEARRREVEEARANAERKRRRTAMALAAALLLVAVIAGGAAVLVDEARRDADTRAAAESKAKQVAELAEAAAVQAQQQAQTQQQQTERERQRAEANFQKARAAVDDYLTKVSEHKLLKVPGMHSLRRDLLLSALVFYKDFLKEHADDPSLRGEVAATQLRLGRINRQLGLNREGNDALDAAIAGFEAALKSAPDHVEARAGLADALHTRALGHTSVGVAGAVVAGLPAQTYQLVQRAAAIREKLQRDHAGIARYQRDVAESYLALAAMADNARTDEALVQMQRAIELLSELALANPEDPENLHALAGAFANLGFLMTKQGRFNEALAVWQRGIDFGQTAYAMMPQAVEYGGQLVSSYMFLGSFSLGAGKDEAAFAAFDQAVEQSARMARDNPHLPDGHALHGLTLAIRGKLQAVKGKKAEAAESRKQARAALDQFPHRTANDFLLEACTRALYVKTMAQMGAVLGTSDDEKEELRRQTDLAVAALQKAVALGYKELEALKTDGNLAPLRERPEFHTLVGKLEAELRAEASSASTPQSAAEKRQAQENALALRLKLAADDPRNRPVQVDLAAGHYNIGLIQLDRGQHDEALKSLGTAQALRAQLVKAAPKNLDYRADLMATQRALGQAAWKAGRLRDAERSWQQSLELLAALGNDDPKNPAWPRQQAEAEFAMGKSYAELGIHDRAAAHFGRAVNWETTDDKADIGDLRIYTTYLVLAGDALGYQKACARLLEKFRQTTNVNRAAQVALCCATGPRAVDDLASVLRLAQQAVAEEPRRAFFHHTLALVHYRLGQFEEALRSLDQADQVDPKWTFRVCNDVVRAMAEHRLGQAGPARQRLTRAVQGFNTEVRRWPWPPSPFGTWTTPYWWNYPYFEVLRHEASMLIDGVPHVDDLIARLEHAHHYHQLGETKRAEAEFEAVVAVRPKEAGVWLTRSRIFTELKRDAQAEADFARAVALQSASPEQWRLQAHFLARHNAWSRALLCYEHAATAVDDFQGGITFAQACLCLLTDDEKGYRGACSQLLQASGNPKVRGFFVARVTTLRAGAADDLARAEKAASAELTNNRTPWALTASAALHCRAGRCPQAVELLRQALRDNAPADSDVVRWLWLALALHGSGQADEARTWLDQARRWLDQHAAGPPRAMHVHDWLEAQVLRREAEARVASARP
jgi:tetratricopeptide (TPR) repeat protein